MKQTLELSLKLSELISSITKSVFDINIITDTYSSHTDS